MLINTMNAPLKQPVMFHLQKTQPGIDSGPFIDIWMAYDVFECDKLTLNAPAVIDIKLQNALSFVLNKLPFKAIWFMICRQYSGETGGPDVYEWPAYFELMKPGLVIMSVPWDMASNHNNTTISDLDAYHFVRLEAIFNKMLEWFINPYLTKICGDTITELPALNTQYYKQTYDNTTPDNPDKLLFSNLWIVTGARNSIDTIYGYGWDDNLQPGDIFDSMNYESVADFLNTLYFADGTFVFYSHTGTALMSKTAFDLDTAVSLSNILSAEISKVFIENGFNNIRTNNTEYFDADIVDVTHSANVVGTADNINNQIIFHNMPSINPNPHNAGGYVSAPTTGVSWRNDFINCWGLNRPTGGQSPNYKRVFLKKEHHKVPKLRLFYLETNKDWMQIYNSKVPVAVHWSYKPPNNDTGITLDDSTMAVPSLTDTINYNDIIKFFQRVQAGYCSHNASGRMLYQTFRDSETLSVRIRTADLIGDLNMPLMTFISRTILFDVADELFGNFNDSYYVAKLEYDVSGGDVLLDLITKGKTKTMGVI